MNRIHACELNGVDPFDHINQLQRHAQELKQTPSEGMAWNYRETLARTRPSSMRHRVGYDAFAWLKG
jgi:hypothetical protein